jgi:cytosine deaminase
MHIPPTPLAGVSNARLPAWALPAAGRRSQRHAAAADLTLRDGQIATIAPSGQPNPGLWDLGGALTLPGLGGTPCPSG